MINITNFVWLQQFSTNNRYIRWKITISLFEAGWFQSYDGVATELKCWLILVILPRTHLNTPQYTLILLSPQFWRLRSVPTFYVKDYNFSFLKAGWFQTSRASTAMDIPMTTPSYTWFSFQGFFPKCYHCESGKQGHFTDGLKEVYSSQSRSDGLNFVQIIHTSWYISESRFLLYDKISTF